MSVVETAPAGMLRDTAPGALAAAVEANLFELFLLFAVWKGTEVRDDGELLWSLTDIPFPLFNAVLHARLSPGRADAAIREAAARAQSRRVPLLWWTGPSTRPADLGQRLLAHGFSNFGPSPGMACDLAQLEAPPAPAGLSIERVDNTERLDAFCRVLASGFDIPDFAREAFYDVFSAIGLTPERPLQHYLGRLGGEPVAGSSVFLAAGVAGVYNVSTIASARLRGFGAALTSRPLLDARGLGYRIGVLNASEEGIGVYRRLGFREYCTLFRYGWAPDDCED
jgi:hypothetical protein